MYNYSIIANDSQPIIMRDARDDPNLAVDEFSQVFYKRLVGVEQFNAY